MLSFPGLLQSYPQPSAPDHSIPHIFLKASALVLAHLEGDRPYLATKSSGVLSTVVLPGTGYLSRFSSNFQGLAQAPDPCPRPRLASIAWGDRGDDRCQLQGRVPSLSDVTGATPRARQGDGSLGLDLTVYHAVSGQGTVPPAGPYFAAKSSGISWMRSIPNSRQSALS